MTQRTQIYGKGDVVLAPFPCTDADVGGRTRPGLVLAALPDDTSLVPTDQILLLCAITTHEPRTPDDIRLVAADFQQGRANFDSTIRVSCIWTIAGARIERRLGRVTPEKLAAVVQALNTLLAR